MLTRPAAQRKPDEDGAMGHEHIAFVHFHLADAHGAPWAPRHRVVRLVDQTAVVTLLEEPPDGVIVLLRHREITATLVRRLPPILFAVPVHPHAETDRLLGLPPCELVHAL